MKPQALRRFPQPLRRFPQPLRRFLSAQPLIRLEFLRIFLPLAILGFFATRILHADDWLTASGFQIPDLGHKDWRQPYYIAPLATWQAWSLAALLALSGLMVSAGFRTRLASGIFFLCLLYVTLADRLEAFTVSKLGTVLMLAIFLTPAGKTFGVDAWLSHRRRRRKADRQVSNAKASIAGASETKAPEDPVHAGSLVTWGNVRFFQVLVVVLYCASGLSKIKGDWLTHPAVLWTHMHDSYQTVLAYWVTRALPGAAWTPLQYLVLGFETLAPIWFSWSLTRRPALIMGLGLHAFIGLCFGPVKWFAILMAVLLLGGFAPRPWLVRMLPRWLGD